MRDAKPRAPLAAPAIAAMAEAWPVAPPATGPGGGAISDVTGGLGAAAGSGLAVEPFWLP
jgi:hypothetical protein